MPEPTKPKVEAPEAIIELVETTNTAYVLLAFIAGAMIVAGIVYYLGAKHVDGGSSDDG